MSGWTQQHGIAVWGTRTHIFGSVVGRPVDKNLAEVLRRLRDVAVQEQHEAMAREGV